MKFELFVEGIVDINKPSVFALISTGGTLLSSKKTNNKKLELSRPSPIALFQTFMSF